MANPNRLEGQIFWKIVMLGAESGPFQKFSRFSSKIVIFKRLGEVPRVGHGWALNFDEQMMKFSTKFDDLIWCQLEHQAFEEKSARKVIQKSR